MKNILPRGLLLLGAGIWFLLGHPKGVSVGAEFQTSIFNPERTNFSLKFKDEVNPYRVLGVFVMPEEVVELECVFTKTGSTFSIEAQAGQLDKLASERWAWKAPSDKGMFPITVRSSDSSSPMQLNVFVMVPFSPDDEKVNDYRIGSYKRKPYKNNPLYNPPAGFVEVTSNNQDVPVSPHFTLGQFVAKQVSHYPKYLFLRERLLLKLEMILEAVNEKGFPARTLHVMSGFRTPFYNQSIGNRTKYSRHLYGDAADIFVDMDRDNRMDDLNGDGQVTMTDATFLADIVKSKVGEVWYQPFVGGLGIYGPKPHRGPFVHIDVRGYKARWTNP